MKVNPSNKQYVFDEWQEPEKTPPLYELIDIDMGDKIQVGWWNGLSFDGYRLKKDESVVRWKKNRNNFH